MVDELESLMRSLDLSSYNVDTEDKKANTEIPPLLSAVINILEKAERVDIITKFLNLVAEGRFPLDNVAFSVFCDVVEWFAKEDTRQICIYWVSSFANHSTTSQNRENATFSAYVLYNLYMQLDYIALEVLTEGLNMYQKASTYDRRQCCVINLYRFHSCSKIESVNKIISPDHVIVTEPFCFQGNS